MAAATTIQVLAQSNLVSGMKKVIKMTKEGFELKDKFRGCLVGAVLGDCLGAPFEGQSKEPIPRKKIESVVGLKSKRLAKAKRGSFYFTDDTAMAHCICSSLLRKKCFDASDLVSTFLNEYVENGDRGYGSGMAVIFDKWQHHGFVADPFLHGREQFSGLGSFGNGAAMRVAPVALFKNQEEDTIELARLTALLTHSNKHGYNGAILQALALQNVVYADHEIEKREFVESLKEKMKKLEEAPVKIATDEEASKFKESESKLPFSRRRDFCFQSQLEKMETLLASSADETPPTFNPDCAVELLGNDVSAQESVPAAIFTFVSCSHLSFSDTLLSAFSMGGDTDTIGTMVGALAGAHFGYSSIPVEWQRVCEGVEEAISFADQFYENMISRK